MHRSFCIFAVVFVSFVSSSPVDLTAANFAENLEKGDWFVEFYAPWCGHCRKLEPLWEQLSVDLAGKANIGRVDCTVEKDLAQNFGIKGFPTILLLRNGGHTQKKYAGPRTVTDFVSFLTEHNVLAVGKMELLYFNSRGRAEAIRLLLEETGVEYNDTRIMDRSTWPELKKELIATGRAPFGQVPAFSYGDTHLVQSHAILRFIARKFGFYGLDEKSETLIDVITDGFEDLRRRYSGVAYDADWKNKIADYRDNALPTWFGYYEAWLTKHNDGTTATTAPIYFVGNRVSWADFVAFDLLDAQLRLFPNILDNYPLLKMFYSSFASRPRIASYLSSDKRANTHQNGVAAFIDNAANPAPINI